MKIGIFGGSFNPIHKGHLHVAETAINTLSLDTLFFVPAYKSPFKDKDEYEDAVHRVNMINEVKPNRSEVSMFEIARKGTSYTIDTVRYFREKYPTAQIFLIIGSDNLYKLHKWKNIDEIAELVNIVVFKREGEFSRVNIKKYNCELLDNELFDFSSSNFKSGAMDNVPKKVMRYIGENYLYVKDIMDNTMDAKRHKHSMAVATLAATYAKLAKASARKAWVAGAFHDITKGWSDQEHREYLEDMGENPFAYPSHELHSATAAIWLANEYMMTDKEIINAVRKHTSLDWDLTQLDKVVFAADKLCEGRKWEGIQTLRNAMLRDFESGFRELVLVVREQIIEKEGKLSYKQDEVFQKWMSWRG